MKIGKSGRKLSASNTKFRKYHPKQDEDSIWIVNEKIGKVVSGQEAPIRKYKWSKSKTSNFSKKSESWQEKSKIKNTQTS